MNYYLVTGTSVVMSSNQRSTLVINQAPGDVIVESTEDYSDAEYTYVNGVFAKATAVVAQERRAERTSEFSQTLDRMSPLWYNSLTTAQQTSLSTWRTEWLNYPGSASAVKPTRPQGIFE